MSYETLLVERDASGITRLTLNRPEKRNAMSALMLEELTDFAGSHGANRDTRAVILAGAGDVFCAGGDLDWMKEQIGADRETRMREARKLAMMLNALNEMPAPLVGAIHGGAFGGGVGLACVCDMAICEEGTKFGLTETRLGLIPATIGPYVIARLGEGPARRVFMSARIMDAEAAAGLGIVADVVPQGALQDAALAEARRYLAVAPGAAGRAKSLARYLGAPITSEVIDASVRRLADAWEDPEAAEGIAAFFEKRAARWVVK